MTSLLSPRRHDDDVLLRASTPAGAGREQDDSGPRLGWVVTAVLAATVALLTGWLLAAGLAVLGWVTGVPGTLSQALSVGTRLWLSAHGVGVVLAGLPVTLVPWGFTALPAFLLWKSARLAGQAGRADQAPTALRVAALTVMVYLVPVLVTGTLMGRLALAPGHVLAALVVLAVAALHGAAGPLPTGWTRRLPWWAAGLPRATVAGLLTLLAGGAAVLVTGLAVHLNRVTTLTDALDTGLAGGVALLVGQLALLPTATIWATGYALGGGFSLGAGSLVSPTSTDLGLLPGLPLLGALPAEGPGTGSGLLWLGVGLLAGGLAAWLALRSLPALRADLSSLVGACAGLPPAGLVVGLGWAASGDLGVDRLAGLGPLLLPLLVMAGSTLGLAGMVTGLVLGLVRRPPAAEAAKEEGEGEGGEEELGEGEAPRQAQGAEVSAPGMEDEAQGMEDEAQGAEDEAQGMEESAQDAEGAAEEQTEVLRRPVDQG